MKIRRWRIYFESLIKCFILKEIRVYTICMHISFQMSTITQRKLFILAAQGYESNYFFRPHSALWQRKSPRLQRLYHRQV